MSGVKKNILTKHNLMIACDGLAKAIRKNDALIDELIDILIEKQIINDFYEKVEREIEELYKRQFKQALKL